MLIVNCLCTFMQCTCNSKVNVLYVQVNVLYVHSLFLFRKLNYIECILNIQALNHLGHILGNIKLIIDSVSL